MLSIKRSPWKSSVACCKNGTRYLPTKIQDRKLNLSYLFTLTSKEPISISRWIIKIEVDLFNIGNSNQQVHSFGQWIWFILNNWGLIQLKE